jgi:phage shock protein PspC (stress-responsive transcriptional regulator)
MKDITRIRIAKSSYDIELSAKKDLEAYIKQLSSYAEDDNVLEDIEIRITELLSDRGVLTNDVIGVDDVRALRETLGEPAAFSSDGDMALGDEADVEIDTKRKLYRDIDHAVIGGVLAGTARYLGVGTAWVRLGFIILLLISFGTAAVVYVVLWVLVPGAVTATEKLQAKGEPLTLGAIRRQREGEITSTTERIASRRKTAGTLVGIIGILGAVCGVIATVAGAMAFYVTVWYENSQYVYEPVVLGLLIAGGLFFTMLWILVAYAGFKRRISRKMLITAIVTIVLGLSAFGSGVGLFGHQAWQRQEAIQKSIIDRPVALPDSFDRMKTLRVDAKNITVTYRVSNERRAYLTSVPGVKTEVQDIDDTTVEITSKANTVDLYTSQPTLVIYGPKVEDIEVVQGMVSYYATDIQPMRARSGDVLSLYGTYRSVQLGVTEVGRVDAEIANILDATVTMDAGGTMALGNVSTLNVTQPTTCGTDVMAILTIGQVSAGKMTVNGEEQPVANVETTCGQIDVDTNEQEFNDEMLNRR